MSSLLALLAAGCSGARAPEAAPAAARTAAQPGATPRPPGSASPPDAPGTPSRPGPVTLAFAGDVHFTGRTARLLRDPATAFGPISPVLRAASFTALNLETAVTS